MKKIILFELNEVPIKIIEFYQKARPDSAFSKIIQQSKKYETFTEDQGHLSPWITWPTLHRGVANNRHLIHDFGENLKEVNKEYPPVWQILTANTINVGLFGSLHSYPPPTDYSNYAYYVPDVFSAGAECFPKSIEAFQDFNLRMSRESSRNVSDKLPWADALKLIASIPELGFKAGTLMDIGGQLMSERIARWKVIRRRTFQSVLSFDVFMKLLKDKRPDFTTFFTNHVASSMHRFWAATFPEDYDSLPFKEEWLQTYNQEILFCMDKANEMLERLYAFVNSHPEYSLYVASSMGQHATECRELETQLYVRNKETFVELFGVTSGEYTFLPAMVPQFNVNVTEDKVNLFKDHLQTFKINGVPVEYRSYDNGVFVIDLGHPNLEGEIGIEINGKQISMDNSGLENMILQDKCSATAYHIPEGCLFVYHPSYKESKDYTKISTLDILPSILSNYNIRKPGYMNKDTYTLA